MKTYKFLYNMQLDFSGVATNHSFTLKCIPHSDERQDISNLEIKVLPALKYEEGVDSFGNSYLFGRNEEPHSKFSISVTGEAVTGKQDFVPGEGEHQLGKYRAYSIYTKPGEKLTAYFKKHYKKQERNLDTALVFMHQLYADFIYQPGATNVRTTAEEAITLGKGVCQDYSHILIGLCQMAGIPARYVVGMLEGEGASHAWVEVYSDGSWYALDPTNNLFVTDGHVKISYGRNYRDCIMNKGVFCGGGVQTQSVQVVLEEIIPAQCV